MSHPLIYTLRQLPSAKRCYTSGDRLFRQDDDVQVLHVIESGQVHLIRHQRKGFSLTLQRAGAGAILAEASLFFPAIPLRRPRRRPGCVQKYWLCALSRNAWMRGLR